MTELLVARRVARVKHVVILGAGFGGLELAGRLSDSVADEVRVTLIDQNDSFTFGFSKLDILFGQAETSALQLRYRDLVKPGVEFRQERVTAIDPAGRHVTTDQGSYDADILVVALGAEYDLDAVPASRRTGSSSTRSPAPSGCATPCRPSPAGRSCSECSPSPTSARRRRSRARSSCTTSWSSGGSASGQRSGSSRRCRRRF